MTVAMQNALPPTIVFTLDVATSASLRANLLKTSGVRAQLCANGLIASIGILNAINLARIDGWRGLLWGVVVFYGAYFVLATLRAFEQCRVRPQPETTLTFAETGFSLERGDARSPATWVPCARVRSVRLTSELIAIHGAWRTYAIIPRSALADDGTQVMRYFFDRIVSQGLSERRSRGVTTLVNSVTPFFARV